MYEHALYEINFKDKQKIKFNINLIPQSNKIKLFLILS